MKSSTAFIVTFTLMTAGFVVVQQLMPNPCIIPSGNLSRDALVLAIGKGCEIDVSKDPMVKAFSDLKETSKLSLDTLESMDIPSWLHFSKGQVQLNDTLEYPRASVVNPSQVIYRSIEDTSSQHVMAILLASSYCSDGAESEAYAEMVTEYSNKNPGDMDQATALAFFAIQNLGCL